MFTLSEEKYDQEGVVHKRLVDLHQLTKYIIHYSTSATASRACLWPNDVQYGVAVANCQFICTLVK